MNVLTLVMTMLMLFSILTYTRLKTFLDFNAVQQEYREYIVGDKLSSFNLIQKNHYNSLLGLDKGTVSREVDLSADEESREPLRSTIPFDYFIDKKTREGKVKEFEHYREITRRLMEYLYSEHPYFKELKEKRPDFINEILDRIVELSDKGLIKKIKNKKNIPNIDLMDKDLEDAFYRIMKGTREKTWKGNEFEERVEYPSLLDFVTFKSGQKAISIYLASGEILMAIYGNKETVNNIFDARKEVLKQLKQNNDFDAGMRELKNLFKGKSVFGNKEDEILDFNVSKTNPAVYQ